MKKTFIVLCIGLAGFASCKKEIKTNNFSKQRVAEPPSLPPPPQYNFWLAINLPSINFNLVQTPFVINGKVYIPDYNNQRIFIYDGASWTSTPYQNLLLPTQRNEEVAFTIGNKAYMGTGLRNYATTMNDFWQYNPSTNVWKRKADLPGLSRDGAVGFSIGSKGYIATGRHIESPAFPPFPLLANLWEYDPATDTWTRKANLPAATRQGAVGFSIGNKGYVATGVLADGTLSKELFEYDPATDTWTQKADFPGDGTSWATSFVLNGTGIVGGGSSSGAYYSYNPYTNTWSQIADHPDHELFMHGFSLGQYGFTFLNTNICCDVIHNHFWKYIPYPPTQ